MLLLFILRSTCLQIKLSNLDVYLKNCENRSESGFYLIEYCQDKKPIDFQLENTGEYMAFAEMNLLEELGKDEKNRIILKNRVENNPSVYQLKLVDKDVFLIMSFNQCLTYSLTRKDFTFETCDYSDYQKYKFRKKIKEISKKEDKVEFPNYKPPVADSKAYKDNFKEF